MKPRLAGGISILTLWGLLLLALGVRYYRLGETPLWVDEVFSWMVAHMRPSQIISYLYQGNNPPLWELILHGWLRLTQNDAEFSVRFLPATFSALTAVVLYYLGQEVGSRSAGLLSGLLWTFSSFAQGVCREARAYGLLALLTALSFLSFTRYLKHQRSIYFWAWLAISILLIHTHYSSFFVPLFQVLWVFFSRREKRFLALLRFGGLMALSLGPAAIVFIYRAYSYQTSGHAPSFSAESVYNLLWAFSNMPIPTVMALSVWSLSIILLVSRWSFLSALRAEKVPTMAKLPLIGFLVFVGLIVGIGWNQPLWQARYFVPLAIMYFWAIGAAIVLWRAAIRFIFFGGLVVAWIVTFHPAPTPPDGSLSTVARAISQKPPHQLLILSPAYMLPVLAYPLREKLFGDKPLPPLEPDPALRLSHELRYHLRLHGASRYANLSPCELLAQDTLLWLDMHLCFGDPDNILEELLLEDFYPISIQRWEKATLTTYRRRESPPPP